LLVIPDLFLPLSHVWQQGNENANSQQGHKDNYDQRA
jgi:hypothetical protein